MSLLAGWAARLARCGCVYNLQDAPHRNIEATLVQVAAACGRHDAVAVPSQWMARSFRPFGLRPRVIPNAVILEDLPVEPADVHALTGWPSDSIVIGLFGRLVAWKGADVLLRAARHVQEGNPRVRFLLVGGTLYGHEPAHNQYLQNRARQLGLADSVHFAGHREDALPLMSGCEAICHCSLEPEPFGMVVLEAMALGKPVVATRSGGPEEIIEHGRTGMLVEPGNDRALAAAIVAIVGDPARRRELGDAARLTVERRFGSAAAGASLSSLYREVVARRSA